MNRDQARAILEHIELIKHFAAGGDIGHRLHDCYGKLVYTAPSKGINLGNLFPGKRTNYVRVRARYKWNPVLKTYERHIRCWPEKILEKDILPCSDREDS